MSTRLHSLRTIAAACICLLPQLCLADPPQIRLTHWDQQVRRDSLQIVKQHADEFADLDLVTTVSRLLANDANCGVRTAAGETLQSLGPHVSIAAARPALLKAQEDPIASVRRAATETLCSVLGPDSVPNEQLNTLLEDEDRLVRAAAKKCISVNRPKQSSVRMQRPKTEVNRDQ